jgi:ABC-2 type transport system permease protein
VAPVALLPAFLLASAGIMSLGAMIAAVAKTARTAQAVGMAIYFPMLFLSGSAFPRAMMPEGVRRISNLLPLSHANELLSGLWLEGAWRPASVAVLAGVLALAGAIAVRNFRWE